MLCKETDYVVEASVHMIILFCVKSVKMSMIYRSLASNHIPFQSIRRPKIDGERIHGILPN